MLVVLTYLNFQHSVFIFVMAYARLATVIYILPVMGDRILANLIVKNMIVTMVILGLWPYFNEPVEPEQGWFIVLVKEFLIGLILAVLLSVPFWVINNIGEIIDNQRGATISDSIDPVNGTQSSVLAGFFSFAFGAIFFACDGMQILIGAMAASYKILPVGASIVGLQISVIGELLDILIRASIMLASPVLIALMVSEVLLGIFSRYCPQLNPFALSLTMKSVISFLVFLTYGFQSLTETPLHLFSSINLSRLIL